jgi:TDG/mug DNA glycosylase family protein
VLPDVLGPDLKVVFCGSAVGDRSAAARAYYAGPGNRFWRTLHEIGLTRDRQLEPHDYPHVLGYGIGLTDLAKHVSGTDERIDRRAFDRDALRAKVLDHKPRALAFNGKFAGARFFQRPVEYGLQADGVGDTLVYVLPSSSAAARRYWDIKVWRELARRVNGRR